MHAAQCTMIRSFKLGSSQFHRKDNLPVRCFCETRSILPSRAKPMLNHPIPRCTCDVDMVVVCVGVHISSLLGVISEFQHRCLWSMQILLTAA
ncbi:hypothetical protein BO99DRAFT_195806 [Aspergillus violaceofuscus CBS 115571]|uniref:Uncharacterized protein n=1 Tax=Aspergillus violaceofuscus (strain CBS 115571) TaxID=1450538 RepID=A0A2V5H095_ASPV1|nr:hypothetical protein BO99DRAFT_195806 [Aspergillus violaceofuscus CBS 115571]